MRGNAPPLLAPGGPPCMISLTENAVDVLGKNISLREGGREGGGWKINFPRIFNY